MSKSVCIVYHSGFGHTARQAEAVAEGVDRVNGAQCALIAVEELESLDSDKWAVLDSADAIVLGCPTYMGSLSAGMKVFMEATSDRWQAQKWANKLAAGFTNSGSRNGDKQNTLVSLITFAAQHGMLWANLNLLPGNNHSGGSESDRNRLGASLGAMAQSNVDEGPEVAPPDSDLETARSLGQRVAELTLR